MRQVWTSWCDDRGDSFRDNKVHWTNGFFPVGFWEADTLDHCKKIEDVKNACVWTTELAKIIEAYVRVEKKFAFHINKNVHQECLLK